jgi:hypothetical protein
MFVVGGFMLLSAVLMLFLNRRRAVSGWLRVLRTTPPLTWRTLSALAATKPSISSAAAMGNLFASPSAQQIYNVARAAHNGAGVLLLFGNYAPRHRSPGVLYRRWRPQSLRSVPRQTRMAG